MEQNYIDIVIERQVILERLKSASVSNFSKELRKIDRLIRVTIAQLETEFNNLSRTKLEKLLRELENDQFLIFNEAIKNMATEMETIGALYLSQEASALKKTVDLRGTKLNAFTKKEVYRKALKTPLATDGDLLEPWLKKFTVKEKNRISNYLRLGHSQGFTNQQIVQALIGTKSRNYVDGVIQTTRRNASTVVRTAIQHVASSARQQLWEANRDVVDRYKFLATLDSVTSNICKSLDSQEFNFGEGPIPPVHPNCRSTTIAILSDEYSFISKGRTRSSATGPVSANTSYFEWLKRQNKQTQEKALGKSRAKIFRTENMGAERFRDLQLDRNFEPLTLKEMKEIEPEAFKESGL